MNTQRSSVLCGTLYDMEKSMPIKSNQVVEDCAELTRNSIT